jgi:parallel beta-helix repeat protein
MKASVFALCRLLLFLCAGFLVLGSGSALLPTPAEGQVLYVDQDAPGPEHDGSTWDTAFLTIQEGVDATTPGGEVWVADGTYVENLVMGEGVQLYGGFLGAEPGGYEDSLDQRDFVNNVTTIDGNQSGSCVLMTVDTRLDGVTITHGTGTPIGGYRYGGGVHCGGPGTSASIANSTIIENSAYIGGGLYCDGSSPTVAHNGISANSASYGGGIGCKGSSATVINNVITSNSASDLGGGICCNQSSPTVANNTITGNSTSGRGGGMCCWSHSSPDVTDNAINDNSAEGDGGGMYCSDSSPAIGGCTISNNWASGNGGGICCSGSYSSPTLIGNTLAGNEAFQYGGALSCCSYCSASVVGNSVVDNRAEWGAGIHCEDSSPVVADNAITGNHAYDSGGGVYCYGASPELTGNGITANSANQNGGGVHCAYYSQPAVTRNTIADNWTSNGAGGGVCCSDHSSPHVSNNAITGNKTFGDYGDGGGLCCLVYSSPTVVNNTISGNSATGYGYGGGVFCQEYSSPIVTNNTITGNSSSSNAGGMCCSYYSWPVVSGNTISYNSGGSHGGGIYCRYMAGPVLVNNVIADNSAHEGGGISCYWECSPVVTCNTIARNSAPKGSGLACDSYQQGYPSDVAVSNCILWDAGGEIWNNDGSVISITYSDVQGGYGGEGNTDADPLFADPDNGDYHLTGESPCIDTGDNSAPALPEYDWEGDERIINGTVDIGADEYVTIYTEAPVPQPECEGPLFGGSQNGFPAWVWFSIPLTPDCPIGDGCADPNALLGFECKGKLWYWDRYGKYSQVYQPPFITWDLAVGNSYLLRLTEPVPNPSYDGLSPFTPSTFEFRLGRQGWTWVGMPGLTELAGEDFMASVRVQYPSDETGCHRTSQEDYDATPDNWITWGWPFYDTYLQAPKTFTPYAPFGNMTCYPWVGYRCWVKIGNPLDEYDPDQVTIIWP